MTWADDHAPKPGDLIYLRYPITGEIFTDNLFTVIANEGAQPAEQVHPQAEWATYWNIEAQCSGACAGVDGCADGPSSHWFLLSAADFILASQVVWA